MKQIGKLDTSKGNAVSNGSLNQLLSYEELCDKMVGGKKEVDRWLEIHEQYKPVKSDKLSLAEYMCTNGGTGTVKCQDFVDFKKSVLKLGSWNEFSCSSVIRVFNEYFNYKVHYGINNCNSGQCDEFEFWIENGDAVIVKKWFYSKSETNKHKTLKKVDNVWNEFEYDEDYLFNSQFLKSSLKADNCTYEEIESEEGKPYYKCIQLRFWWD